MARIENKDIVAPNLGKPTLKTFQEWNKVLPVTVDFLEEMLKVTTDITKVIPKTNKGMRDFNDAAASQKQIITTLEKAQEKATKTQEKQRISEDRLNKQRKKAFDDFEKKLIKEKKAVKKAKIEQDKLNNEYLQSTKALNKMALELKRVAIVEGVNATKTKVLAKEYNKLRAKVLGAEKVAGQFQRNVGNYPSVIGKATSALKSLGLAFGGAFLVRGGLKVLKDYDEALADIAKTTGLTTEQARLLSQELLKIDTKTSITALQELATAAGRLGIEGSESILGFVKAADQAFVALGDDLGGTADEIATGLGKISSLFGLEQEFGIEQGILRVGSGLNELSANSKASAGAIDDFTKRMSGLSAIVELGDVQALGAFFDEAGQSVEVASSTLGKLLPAIGKDIDKFAKVAGLTAEEFKNIADKSPIEALKLVAKGARSSEGGLSGLADTMEQYGVTSARAANVLNVLSNNTDRLTELQGIANGAIETGTSLTDEFGIKNETLGATYDKLVKEVQKLVLGMDEAGNATGFLVTAMKFLIANLGTIVTVIKNVAIAWITYKVALKLVNEETGKFKKLGLISFFKRLITGIKGLAKGTKTVAGGFKSMGSAMKAIPLVALISGITTAISVIWDLISGTDAATRAQNELNKKLREEIELRKEQVEARRTELGDITERVSAIAKLSGVGVKKLGEDISIEIDKLQGELDVVTATVEKFDKASKEIFTTWDDNTTVVSANADGMLEVNEAVNETRKNTEILSETQSESKIELEAQLKLLQQQLIVVKKFKPIKILPSKKKGKEELDRLKAINQLEKDRNKILAERAKIVEAINAAEIAGEVSDLQRAINEELERQLEFADITPEFVNIDKLEALLNERFELEKQAIESQRNFRLTQLKEEEELFRKKIRENQNLTAKEKSDIIDENEQLIREKRQLILTESNNDLKKLENERVDIIDETNDEIIEAQIEGAQKQADAQKEIRDKELAAEKKALEERVKITKTVLELLSELNKEFSEQRLENIDKQLEASQDLQSNLEALAKDEVLNAEDSIIAEKKKQDELELQKQREIERAQRVDVLLAGIESYTARIGQGEAPAAAVAGAITDIKVLTAALKAIDFFFEGTEDTGTANNPLDSNGGRLAVLHDNERVMTAEQNKMVSGMTNWELANLGAKYKAGITDVDSAIRVQRFQDDSAILRKFDELKTEVMKSKSDTNFYYDGIKNAMVKEVRTKDKIERTLIKSGGIFG